MGGSAPCAALAAGLGTIVLRTALAQPRELAVLVGNAFLHEVAVHRLHHVGLAALGGRALAHAAHDGLDAALVAHLGPIGLDARGLLHVAHARDQQRSEERRVGKECRSRWSPYP